MGTIFVDKLDPQSGTSLELGSSGDTVAVNTGATTNLAGNVTLGASGKTITIPSGCTITNSGTASGFGGGGKIGQVIQTVVADNVDVTSSSGTFADISGFTANITPSATDSKILVMATINYGGTSNLYGAVRLVRGSTAIGIGNAAGNRTRSSAFTSSDDNSKAYSATFDFLDTPSSTSQQAYKIQVTLNSGQTFKLNSEGENIDNAANHRTISTMTLMEILA